MHLGNVILALVSEVPSPYKVDLQIDKKHALDSYWCSST